MTPTVVGRVEHGLDDNGVEGEADGADQAADERAVPPPGPLVRRFHFAKHPHRSKLFTKMLLLRLFCSAQLVQRLWRAEFKPAQNSQIVCAAAASRKRQQRHVVFVFW